MIEGHSHGVVSQGQINQEAVNLFITRAGECYSTLSIHVPDRIVKIQRTDAGHLKPPCHGSRSRLFEVSLIPRFITKSPNVARRRGFLFVRD
jgi:hypothetical protein